MKSRQAFRACYRIRRHKQAPAVESNYLWREFNSIYVAAGTCRVAEAQIFLGWVNEDRWRLWLRLKMDWWERKYQS